MQYKDNDGLFVSQAKYVKEILRKASMETYKPAPTPTKPYTQLLVSEGEPLFDPSFYRSLTRALQ